MEFTFPKTSLKHSDIKIPGRYIIQRVENCKKLSTYYNELQNTKENYKKKEINNYLLFRILYSLHKY